MKCSPLSEPRYSVRRFVIRAACILMTCHLAVFSAGQTVASSGIRAIVPAAHPASDASQRAVTVLDSIQMTRFGDPYYAAGGSAKGTVAKFSPNGAQFVIVLKKGDLEDNTNQYSLVLFKTAEGFRSPKPRTLVSMHTSSNQPAIHSVVWLNDNDTLLFLGERPGEASQVYRVRCSSMQLTKLTHYESKVTSFVTTSSGQEIVYSTENRVASLRSKNVSRNGFSVTHQYLSDLLSGGSGIRGNHILFVKHKGSGSEIEIKLRGQVDYADEIPMALSPDGKHLLIQTMASWIPEAWNGYDDESLQTIVRRPPKPGVPSGILQYELVDTRTGASAPFLDTPIPSLGSEMAWSPDSKSVVLSNLYLPLDVADPELSRRKTQTFLVEFNVTGRRFQVVSDGDLKLMKWDPKTGIVICDVGRINSLNGKDTPQAYFRKNGGTWSTVSASEESILSPLPDIVLEENMNTPPRIVAISSGDGKKSLLMDLNPQFKELAFARVEEISWRNRVGEEEKGGLYWPFHFVAGRKYPLVIQTHGWSPDRFWIDGPWSTAFAAQALAARGLFVLQLNEESAKNLSDTPREAPTAVGDYETAIDNLDSRGLIDRNLVGIIGFSRTCYYVTQMLAFSNYNIAAGVIADGFDASYFQYFTLSNAVPGVAAEFEALNGRAPFGNSLFSWIERVSAFHMDRVRSPLRIQALGPGSLLLEWDWFAGLSGLGKPVDMVYIPDGVHILEKPWDRMISQQGDVDWFCFWLKGEEDPDPAKAEQYRHWRELRALTEPATSRVGIQ